MIDAKTLLDRFLGSGDPRRASSSPWGGPGTGASRPGSPGELSLGGLTQAARQILGQGGPGKIAGAAAAGGLLTAFLGRKKGKKHRGGGLLSHGGAALLGALAHRAWQGWQAGQQPSSVQPAGEPVSTGLVDARFMPATMPPSGDGAFELTLIRAMIGAARADGHVDGEERDRIFEQVERAGMDPEEKAFVFEALERPIGVAEIAAAARTPEQASEVYLASRLTIDVDSAAERAYLAALAHRLGLAPALVAHLDRQAELALLDSPAQEPGGAE